MSRISTYNGDVLDKYWWAQGWNDVQIQLNIPPGIKKKDL